MLWGISITANKPVTVCQVRSKPDKSFVYPQSEASCTSFLTLASADSAPWFFQKIKEKRYAYKQKLLGDSVLHVPAPTATHQCFLCGGFGRRLCLNIQSSCSFRTARNKLFFSTQLAWPKRENQETCQNFSFSFWLVSCFLTVFCPIWAVTQSWTNAGPLP